MCTNQAHTDTNAELANAVFTLREGCVLGGRQQNIAPRIQRHVFTRDLYPHTGNVISGTNRDILAGINGGALRVGTVVTTVLRGRPRR